MKRFLKTTFIAVIWMFLTQNAFAQVMLDLSVFGEEEVEEKKQPEPKTIKVERQKVISEIKPRSKPVEKVKVVKENVSEIPAELLEKKEAEVKRQAELKKQAEEKRQAELKKQAEERRQAELKKKEAEERRQAELKKKEAEERRQAELKKKEAEERRQAELKKQAEEKHQAELERLEQERQNTVLARLQRYGVFMPLDSLTSEQRTALLEKEIPEDSATKRALRRKNDFVQMFVFSDGESVLSEAMQEALELVAQQLKGQKNKTAYLYSYSGSGPASVGKERPFSLRRALLVRAYLTKLGVPSLQIELRSQGKKGAGENIPNRVDILIEN